MEFAGTCLLSALCCLLSSPNLDVSRDFKSDLFYFVILETRLSGDKGFVVFYVLLAFLAFWLFWLAWLCGSFFSGLGKNL